MCGRPADVLLLVYMKMTVFKEHLKLQYLKASSQSNMASKLMICVLQEPSRLQQWGRQSWPAACAAQACC